MSMRCKLLNPYSDMPAHWVDWPSIEPLWKKNDFHPLDPTTLKRAYHGLWFADIDGKRSHFTIGGASYDDNNGSLMFSNGRNRTLLLSTLTHRVPLALDVDSLAVPEIRKSIVAPITAADVLTLPELSVLTFAELQ